LELFGDPSGRRGDHEAQNLQPTVLVKSFPFGLTRNRVNLKTVATFTTIVRIKEGKTIWDRLKKIAWTITSGVTITVPRICSPKASLNSVL
jgi:hypothetical protein